LAIETEFVLIDDGGLGSNSPSDLNKNLNERTDQEIYDDFAQTKKEEEFTGKIVETFFVTTDYGVKRQDVIKFEECDETMLGVQVPFFYYMGRRQAEEQNEDEDELEEEKEETMQNMLIIRKSMKDFVGLEHVDETVR